MGQLGVLFSLDEKTVSQLRSYPSDEERLEYLQEEIETNYFDKHPEWIAELDKSWDALHRCLTDGELTWVNGSFPLNHVVLGGEILYQEDDYIMTLKTPEQVKAIAEKLVSVTKVDLHKSYWKINKEDYGFNLHEDDFKYTWEWFENSMPFWDKAAIEKRYVLFTADQ